MDENSDASDASFPLRAAIKISQESATAHALRVEVGLWFNKWIETEGSTHSETEMITFDTLHPFHRDALVALAKEMLR